MRLENLVAPPPRIRPGADDSRRSDEPPSRRTSGPRTTRSAPYEGASLQLKGDICRLGELFGVRHDDDAFVAFMRRVSKDGRPWALTVVLRGSLPLATRTSG